MWKSLSLIPFLSLSGERKKKKIEPSLTVHRAVWCVAGRNTYHYKVKSNSAKPTAGFIITFVGGWRVSVKVGGVGCY